MMRPIPIFISRGGSTCKKWIETTLVNGTKIYDCAPIPKDEAIVTVVVALIFVVAFYFILREIVF